MPAPRGTCPDCGAWVKLKTGGRLRPHTRFSKEHSRTVKCSGSGKAVTADSRGRG